MSKWLWIAYPLALVGVGAVWGSVLQILLGRQVAAFVPDVQAQAGALGLVVSISSITAVFAQPVMGRLSDLTRTRFLGRRNIWVLLGGIASSVALVITGLTTSAVALTIAWAITILPVSAVQAALTAVLPERVPLRRRGTMSALVGVATIIGGVIGAVLASGSGPLVVPYISVAVFLFVTSVLFAFTTKDVAYTVSLETAEERRLSRKLPGFRAYPDYWWTFIQRSTLMLGYFFFTGFSLYMLRDYIGVDGGLDGAAKVIASTVAFSSLAILVFAVMGGILVDKFGKVRIFIVIATAMFAPAAVLLIFVPTIQSYVIGAVILGAAFGTYLSVDQVLISRVIPGGANSARDLGVLNIANSGAQVIAPAIAGAIIAATGAYQILFVVMIALVIVSAFSVRFIKNVP